MEAKIEEIDAIQKEVKLVDHPYTKDVLTNIIKEIKYYQDRTTSQDKFFAYELAIEIIKDRINI